MYTAKEEYYTALYEKPVVKSYVTGAIFLDDAAISISDKNIIRGSLSVNNRCVNGSSFEYGAVYQGEMNVTLLIDAGRYSLYDREIGLTAHYVLEDGEVSIPLGKWHISTPERSRKLLTIKALDAMSNFSEIIPAAFSGTVYEMLSAACTACGVPLGMTREEVEALTNGGVSFYANTEHFETYRDLLSYLGKCTCTFATIDRYGALVLREYGTEPVRTIPETRRRGTVVADYETYYKAVKMRFLADENFFPYEQGSGDDGITMDLGDIPIVSGTAEEKQAVCDAIYEKLAGVRYTPAYFVQLIGDPALELGDMITVDGQNTYVTAYTWMHRGSMRVQGVGDDAKHPKFKNKNQVDIPALNDTLSGLEKELEEVDEGLQQALKEATELINGTAGGYFTIVTGKVVVDGVEREVPIGWRIMDTPSLTENTKLWQMSLGGFAFSKDGGRTFSNVAIDMDGNITANHMTTGTLDCTNINVIGLVVGDNVTMGANAVLTWDNLPYSVASIFDIPSDSDITTITQNAISTGNVIIGGFIYDKTASGKQVILGVNSSGNLQVGTPSASASYRHLNLYAGYGGEIRFFPDASGVSAAGSVLDLSDSGADLWVTLNCFDIDAMDITCDSLECGSLSLGTLYCSYVGSSYDYPTIVHCNNVAVHTSTTLSNNNAGFNSTYGYIQEYSGSSKKFKHDIRSMPDELKTKMKGLYNVEVKCWKYNEDYLAEEDELFGVETFGLIAEDLNEVLPEAITHKADGSISNYRDRNLINAMLYLLQEQHKEIEDLKKRVEILEQGVM